MISIVIPAFNEENGISETVRDAFRVLAGAGIIDPEVVVIDDGSSDKTAETATAEGARVVRHPHNVGYGAALKTGILKAKYDVIAITDADKTYPIVQLPQLLAKYHQGFDMVIGARTGDHYSESFKKSMLRWILTFLVEFTSGRKVPDVNSGFRVFNRTVAQHYFDHLCDTFSFTTSLTLAYMMTGRFVTYVPIPYDKREGQSKVRLFRDSLRTLEYIVLAATYYDPLKLFILFSMICIILSFAGFGLSIIVGVRGGYFLGLGGLLVALLVFSIGLLASLLKQIMDKRG